MPTGYSPAGLSYTAFVLINHTQPANHLSQMSRNYNNSEF